MLNAIIDWSLKHRFIVIVLSLLLIGGGLWSMSRLEIDAFPDTTPVQVQINTVAAALGPVEIEQQVTLPVENSLGGLPGLKEMRSISKFGLSQVTATFEDGTDIYFARQQINERLVTVELPEGIARPEMGPPATGLGEVFHYIVTGKGPNPPTLTELTTIHDWQIRPRLFVPGVAEVNTWGGQRRQIEVQADPDRLIKFKLTLDELRDALAQNNSSVGGGYLVQSGEAVIVQGSALTTSLKQIEDIVITARDGVPVRVRDVSNVVEGHALRRGGVTANGQGEVVLGLGFMRMGENSHVVTKRLEQRLAEISESLPENVDVQIVYERTELVDKVIATVRRNLWEGALLVVAVLFVFLGNLRAGLIVALAIPLAMLFSFSAMLQFGISASLLSLGAIDFGLVVDSSVIIVENCVRRLGKKSEVGGQRSEVNDQRAAASPPAAAPELDQTSVMEIIREASVEVRRPTMFGELIIMVVYLPILLLEGVEGKMFRPMALTVVFALAASLVLSLTLTPVLCSLLLSRKVKEREGFIVRWLQALYRPIVRLALRFRWSTLLLGALLLAFGAWLATTLGTSFIPRLYEQALTINTIRLAGVSLEESLRYGNEIEKIILRDYPDEVRDIWSRTGTAEVATDPMGLEVTDVYLTLHPQENWTKARTQAELTEIMAADLGKLPGMRVVFTQPIELRMNEMVAGVRADVGVKIFGDDLDQLRVIAQQAQSVLESIPGAADVAVEQLTGQPLLQVQVDQDAIARHGVPAAHVLEIIEAIGGITVGEVREGQRRVDLVIRLPESRRLDPEAIGDIMVPTADGRQLALKQLARITQTEGPTVVNRESQKRRIVVQTNVRGRDLGGFVHEARTRLHEDLTMPQGYYITFGGQFEHLERAQTRLLIIVPIALALIFTLLYLSIGTIRDSFIVLTGAPFAALGGVLALWIRDLEFTISAAIGFIAVSGVAMLSGLVLVSTIKQRIAQGDDINQAIEQTRLIRLRPILMTALVAALGFVPMALNTGVGAEVQRPLATVVIGGVIADNLLTLLMLPAMYSLFGSRRIG